MLQELQNWILLVHRCIHQMGLEDVHGSLKCHLVAQSSRFENMHVQLDTDLPEFLGFRCGCIRGWRSEAMGVEQVRDTTARAAATFIRHITASW